MRIRSLTQVVEIVYAMLQPKRIVVLGSSSLLATRPELGEIGQPLEFSMDADLLVEPCDEKEAAVVHEAVGEGSLFHHEYGVYVDLMRPNILELFPGDWERRVVALENKVVCLHPLDLALMKLCLGRDKDRDILKALLSCGVITIAELRSAYQSMPLDDETLFKAGRLLTWLDRGV